MVVEEDGGAARRDGDGDGDATAGALPEEDACGSLEALEGGARAAHRQHPSASGACEGGRHVRLACAARRARRFPRLAVCVLHRRTHR